MTDLDSKFIESLPPVSYTHIDVYKRQIQDKSYEYNRNFHIVYVDLKQGFDSLNRKNCSSKSTYTIKRFYIDKLFLYFKPSKRFNEELTVTFDTNASLRQGLH